MSRPSASSIAPNRPEQLIMSLAQVSRKVVKSVYAVSDCLIFKSYEIVSEHQGACYSILQTEQAEGVGARVRRTIGTPGLRNLSQYSVLPRGSIPSNMSSKLSIVLLWVITIAPFLMLDHFNVGPGAGFPDHPHRGQGKASINFHFASSPFPPCSVIYVDRNSY